MCILLEQLFMSTFLIEVTKSVIVSFPIRLIGGFFDRKINSRFLLIFL